MHLVSAGKPREDVVREMRQGWVATTIKHNSPGRGAPSASAERLSEVHWNADTGIQVTVAARTRPIGPISKSPLRGAGG
jgi:hypothetical protein